MALVVYFDKCLSGVQSKCWSKDPFLCFCTILLDFNANVLKMRNFVKIVMIFAHKKPHFLVQTMFIFTFGNHELLKGPVCNPFTHTYFGDWVPKIPTFRPQNCQIWPNTTQLRTMCKYSFNIKWRTHRYNNFLLVYTFNLFGAQRFGGQTQVVNWRVTI